VSNAIRKISDLFDTKSEILGWIFTIALLVALFGRFEIGDNWVTAMVATLVTMLGTEYFHGVRVSPGSIEINE